MSLRRTALDWTAWRKWTCWRGEGLGRNAAGAVTAVSLCGIAGDGKSSDEAGLPNDALRGCVCKGQAIVRGSREGDGCGLDDGGQGAAMMEERFGTDGSTVWMTHRARENASEACEGTVWSVLHGSAHAGAVRRKSDGC